MMNILKRTINIFIFCVAINIIACCSVAQAQTYFPPQGSSMETAINSAILSSVGADEAAEQGLKLAVTQSGGSWDKTKCGYSSETHCMPYCKYNVHEIANKTSCFLCPIFAVVFNTVSEVQAKAIESFTEPVKTVVIVAFAVWLAIQVLMFVSSPETRDLKDIMQSVMIQGFLVMLVVAILQTGVANFNSTFIFPVYNTGLNMAKAVSDVNSCGTKVEGFTCPGEEDKKVSQRGFTDLISADKKGGLPQKMGASILQTMTMMENRILKFKALGSSIMCQSWKERYILVPKPIYLITGFLIWAVCMALIVGIPFLMVDSIFQLSVASALLPAAVGCFAFKSTRQYSKKVWETYLNSMFAFLFISVVVVIVLGTIQASVTMGMEQVASGGGSFDGMFEPDGASETFFSDMLERFAWFSPHFIRLIFVFVLAWSVMSMAKEFAGEFADSISNTSIGSSIGTMAASSAKGMGMKIGKPLAEAGGKALTRGTGRLLSRSGRAVSHGVRRWKNRKDRRNFENNQGNVQIQDGKKTLEMKKGNATIKYNEENGAMTKETIKSKDVKTENGQVVRKREESVKKVITTDLTIITTTITEREKDNNGNWKIVSQTVREKVKFNNESAERFMDRKGNIDTDRMRKMTENLSGDAKKTVQMALTKMVAKKRFSKASYDYDRAKLKKEPEIVSVNENGDMVLKEITTNGKVVFTSIKMRGDIAETEQTIINKKGEVTKMYSDGIRNRMVKTKLKSGQSAENLRSLEEVNAASDNKNKKVAYGYTKYWQRMIDDGRIRPEEVPLGAMGEEEVFGKNVVMSGDKKIGTILGDNRVVDDEGNTIGFRDRAGRIVDEGGNVLHKNSERQKVGGEFMDFIYSEGNEMQKSDMKWFFR